MPKIDKVWPTWTEQKARLAQMDEKPRMPVIGSSDQAELLKPILQRIQQIDWLAQNCMLVFDDTTPKAMPDMVIQSRGEKWFTEIKKQRKRPIIQGTTSIDKGTGRIRITIYGQGNRESQVLIEEIYHIIFEIIRRVRPKIFTTLERWHDKRLKQGCDPRWQMHEAFADMMVREEQLPGSTDLPRSVVKYGQKSFSAASTVPVSVMENIKAG